MILLFASAAFVGFVHSLAPGHWLPVVLMSKAKKWPLQSAVLAAAVTASGHILISTLLGTGSILIGAHFLVRYEEQIEKDASLMLVAFGLAYALWAYFRHSGCHGHTHHGPAFAEEMDSAHSHHSHQEKAGERPSKRSLQASKRHPWLFLFSLGFSPCVAALPVFIASSAKGAVATAFTMMAFSVGVLLSLVGSTLLISLSTRRLDHAFLDHPLFEHYGDVIAGLSIFLMGVVLFFHPI